MHTVVECEHEGPSHSGYDAAGNKAWSAATVTPVLGPTQGWSPHNIVHPTDVVVSSVGLGNLVDPHARLPPVIASPRLGFARSHHMG